MQFSPRERAQKPASISYKSLFKVFLLFAAGLLLIAACSKISPTPQPDLLVHHSGNYDTTTNITYKELSATATIKRETPQACSVVFTSPPSLENMAFVFRQDAVDLSYKGLSFTFDPSSVPGGAIASMTVSAVNRAMKGEGLSVDFTEGVLTLNGVMDSGAFSLRLDPADGNLIKLSVPQEELEIEFVNFRFLD